MKGLVNALSTHVWDRQILSLDKRQEGKEKGKRKNPETNDMTIT